MLTFKEYLKEAILSGPELTKKDLYIDNLYNRINNEEALTMNSKELVVFDKKDKDVKDLLSALKDKDVASILSVIADTSGKTLKYKKVFSTTDGRTIAINELSKDSVKDSSASSRDANSTAMQENASLFCFKYALENSGEFPDITEIAKIYPEVTELKNGWFDSFKAQTDVVLDELKDYKFKEYVRDGSFMSFISKKVASLGFTPKDAWNPADVWLMKDKWNSSSKLFKLLDEAETINSVNMILRNSFENKSIVGISLKKTKKTAKWEIYNDDNYFKQLKDYLINYKEGNLDLSLKNGYFANNEYKFECQNNVKGQFRMNSNGTNFLEFSKKGGSAMLGKCPRSVLEEYLKEYNFKIPSKNTVPNTKEDIIDAIKEYAGYVDKINKSEIATTNVTKEEFINNINKILETAEREIILKIVGKLQAIQLCYYFSVIMKKSDKKFDKMITELILAAEKGGEKNGPFAKIS